MERILRPPSPGRMVHFWASVPLTSYICRFAPLSLPAPETSSARPFWAERIVYATPDLTRYQSWERVPLSAYCQTLVPLVVPPASTSRRFPALPVWMV